MANREQVAILSSSVDEWNGWRVRKRVYTPDLIEADLSDMDLAVADLRGANLHGARLFNARLNGAFLDAADLGNAQLVGANLSNAHLTQTILSGADLTAAFLAGADLTRADLTGANLTAARFDRANLAGADLRGAWLIMASLVMTDLRGTDLRGCNVYGASVWDPKIDAETRQSNLIITFVGPSEVNPSGMEITVDDLQVAQFIYLMLNNQNVRRVIDTVTSKSVLILGRFTPDRKVVLDALREELRRRNYLPIVFDFEVPDSRDITETVSLLARMARFVVADLTDAKSLPQELAVIVSDLPSVPVQPLLNSVNAAYGMFEHWQRFPWVLPVCKYDNVDELLASLSERIIVPAERKVLELRRKT